MHFVDILKLKINNRCIFSVFRLIQLRKNCQTDQTCEEIVKKRFVYQNDFCGNFSAKQISVESFQQSKYLWVFFTQSKFL